MVGGVVYIFSTIGEPDVIEHTGGPAWIVYGELDGNRSDRLKRFHEHFARATGMEGVVSESIRTELWEKSVFISVISGVTAAIRLPDGATRDEKSFWDPFVGSPEEARDAAIAEGVQVTDDIVEERTAFARDLDPGMYSSLHYDMTNGKRTELEAIHGTVVRKADEHGVDAPRSRTVYSILRPWAVRNDETN